VIKKAPSGTKVVTLDDVRRKRMESDIKRVRGGTVDTSSGHTGPTPELANSITLQESFVIARGIVKKYAVEGSLLRAYLERRKKEPVGVNSEEFHKALASQKGSVSPYKTLDLRAFLVLYSRNPTQFYEIYAICVAEEYLSRFPRVSDEKKTMN